MIKGTTWVFGDNIDTDLLAPGYLMKLPANKLAEHCLEAVNPVFASSVQPGDILVAGENFGLGSSREQAAISLKLLGISCVLAKSFARIFYRNALNIGLPVLVLPRDFVIEEGDTLSIEPESGAIANISRAATIRTVPIPSHLMNMVRAGGLLAHLKQNVSSKSLKENAI